MMLETQAESFTTKEKNLREIVRGLKRVVVGYSGGVDSAVVAKVATEELKEDALIAIADSPSLPRSELAEAVQLARDHGFNLRVINTLEVEKDEYLANPNNRCFYCKTELYTDLKNIMLKEHYAAILDGANLDDLGDYRPGRQAAKENDVHSILVEAKFRKSEVRQLAQQLGLRNYDKPAAACLSSRFPYGTSISKEKLSQVEKAEEYLKSLGLRNLRVRYHQEIARIEAPTDDFFIVLEHKKDIYAYFQSIGFKYTALDLLGFRSGSLNEKLPPQ